MKKKIQKFLKLLGLEKNLATNSRTWCWDETLWICKEYDDYNQWVKNLVISLISCCYRSFDTDIPLLDHDQSKIEGRSDFFLICASIAFQKHEFASTIFPGILYDLLSNDKNELFQGAPNTSNHNEDKLAGESVSPRESILSEVSIGKPKSVANQRLSACFTCLLRDCAISAEEYQEEFNVTNIQDLQNINTNAICLLLDTLDFFVKITEYQFSASKHHRANEEIKSDRVFRERIGRPSVLSNKSEIDHDFIIDSSPIWRGRSYGVVLHLNGIDIAQACVRAKRYTSGLFYASLVADNYFGGEGGILERLAKECVNHEREESLHLTGCFDVSGFGEVLVDKKNLNEDVVAQKLHKILKICFTELHEVDAVRGVEAFEPAIFFKPDNRIHRGSVLKPTYQNQNDLSGLLNLDSMLQGNQAIFSSNTVEMTKMLKSLGLRHIMQYYLAGYNSICDSIDVEQSKKTVFREELFEGAWRSLLWDESISNEDVLHNSLSSSFPNGIPTSTAPLQLINTDILTCGLGFNESLYGIFRCVRNEDSDNINLFLTKARNSVINDICSSRTNIDLAVISTRAKILNDIEDAVQAFFSDLSPFNLLEQWGLPHSKEPDSLHNVMWTNKCINAPIHEEILYAVREVILRLYTKYFERHGHDSKSILFAHMWTFCTWSQTTGNSEIARTSFRRMCRLVETKIDRVVPIILRTQMQLEEANILMCGGDAKGAIRKAKLVADNLKNNCIGRSKDTDIHEVDTLMKEEGLDILHAQALLKIGQWTASYNIMPARSVLQQYLKPGLELAENLYSRRRNNFNSSQLVSASLSLAEFVANMFDGVSNRIASHEWKKAGEAAEQRQMEWKKCADLCEESRKKYLEAKQNFSRRKSSGSKNILAQRENEYREISIHSGTLKKEIELDTKERLLVEKSKAEFLHQALHSFGIALSLSSHNEKVGTMSRYVFRMVSLWFTNCESLEDSKNVNDTMMKIAKKVPSYRFVPLTYQIFSRIELLDKTQQENAFQVVLRELIILICADHPYHSLVQLIALSNGNKVGTGVSGRQSNAYLENVGASKVEAAQELLEILKNMRNHYVPSLIESYTSLINSCIDLAMAPTNQFKTGGRQQVKNIKLSEVMTGTSDGRQTKLDRCLGIDFLRRYSSPPCVLTQPPIIRPSKDYGEGKEDPIGSERIKTFDPTFSLTETGLHRPKIVVCNGTKGGKFVQLVKGEDDVRQDAIMQQVFSTVNDLLHSRSHSNTKHDYDNQFKSKSDANHDSHSFEYSTHTKQLRISTYNIIPLSPASGVIEWVNNTLPFGDYLRDKVIRGKRIRVGAHSKYYPGEWSHKLCHMFYSNVAPSARRETFDKICKNFSPAFRFFFLERFTQSPEAWHTARMRYTRSCAVTSIVGHVLGIGDRHSYNILVNEKTGEVVHIDFGIVFEQGKCLLSPETVPFRLTRDIVDGMGPSATEGSFSHAAASTTQVLRNNAQALLTILSAVVSDPLYKWSVSPVKARQRQMGEQDENRTNVIQENDSLINDKDNTTETNNDAANRAISKIREKLQGYEEGTRGEKQSVEGQVQLLINSARDHDNLCRLYEGWAPWL